MKTPGLPMTLLPDPGKSPSQLTTGYLVLGPQSRLRPRPRPRPWTAASLTEQISESPARSCQTPAVTYSAAAASAAKVLRHRDAGSDPRPADVNLS